jgi:hypothetical protein
MLGVFVGTCMQLVTACKFTPRCATSFVFEKFPGVNIHGSQVICRICNFVLIILFSSKNESREAIGSEFRAGVPDLAF